MIHEPHRHRVRFKKVKHTGSHQDYRILLNDTHVGNIRAGFKNARGRGRTKNWTARSDVEGVEITVRGAGPRWSIAQKLIRCLSELGAFRAYPPPKFMQTTRDVGADEKPQRTPVSADYLAKCKARR